MRSFEVTATARSLPDLISGSAAARLVKLMVTAPVATSVTAGAAAAIRHVQHVDAGHDVHQFAGELLRIADAGRRERQLPGIGLGVGDQLLRIVHRRRPATTTTQGTMPISAIGASSRSGS